MDIRQNYKRLKQKWRKCAESWNEVVLVQSNLVDNKYQQKSEVFTKVSFYSNQV